MNASKAFAAFLLCSLLPNAQAEVRTWTDATGRQLQAEMVGFDEVAKVVTLRMGNGQVGKVPLGKLSPADVAFAEAQAKLLRQTGAAKGAGQAARPRYTARCSESERLARITAGGGVAAYEEAVKKSLRWLAAQQNADGSWGGSSTVGYTALALQCFTGHCEGVSSTEHGATVLKALEFLMKTAAANPQGILSQDPKRAAGGYEHGIATTALGEAVIISGLEGQVPPGLRETFEKAVGVIITCQGPSDLWSYYTAPLVAGEALGKSSDLSLSNWQLQALVVAKESGINFAGLDACVSNAVGALKDKQTKLVW